MQTFISLVKMFFFLWLIPASFLYFLSFFEPLGQKNAYIFTLFTWPFFLFFIGKALIQFGRD